MNGQQQHQVPFEKILEKYGKACLERDMAFDNIAVLEKEIKLLKDSDQGQTAKVPGFDNDRI